MAANKQNHASVLNTDSFDRRRFGQLFDMSEKMQKIEREGRNAFPSFLPLMSDMWAGMFKMKPELHEKVDPKLQMNRQLMERVMAEEGYQQFREFTRLDDLSSALGAMKYSETALEWIKEQADRDQQLAEALQKAKQGKRGAMQKASQAMQQALDQNGNSLTKALQQASQEAKQAKDNVKSLLGGLGAGNEEAELKKVPLRDQLKLAEQLSSNQKLRRIAKWAGRMKLVAQKKQRNKHNEAIDRSGITQGNQIEKLLPSELAAFSSPLTKQDFLRRFVEGQTLQYDTKGKEQLGKGPIVLCLDQSGSMSDQDDISKGFVLALMSVARKQRRDFALILFSNFAESPKVFERGKISMDDMIDIATTFIDGGTNFEAPLATATKVIEKSRFNKADIVFVTDGEARVSNEFIGKWNELKAKRDFRVLSLILGTRTSAVQLFSDRVILAEDFQDKAVHQAFEI